MHTPSGEQKLFDLQLQQQQQQQIADQE